LFIFGPAVERRLGHVRLAVLFLISGIGSNAVHLLVHASSGQPLVGASGAVAGVMGAYLLLFPRKQLVDLGPGRYAWQPRSVSAAACLGVWFLLLWLQGIGSIGAVVPGQSALWVHLSGFVFGMIGAVLLHPS
jgi:membrane associated rhomboid family serine protease